MYCNQCHNARSLAERPFANYQNVAAHMRVRAQFTGEEYEKLMEFLRRWHDVPAAHPAGRTVAQAADLRRNRSPSFAKRSRRRRSRRPARSRNRRPRPEPPPRRAGRAAAPARTTARRAMIPGTRGRRSASPGRLGAGSTRSGLPRDPVRGPGRAQGEAADGRPPVGLPVRADDPEVAWLVEPGVVVIRIRPGNRGGLRVEVAQQAMESVVLRLLDRGAGSDDVLGLRSGPRPPPGWTDRGPRTGPGRVSWVTASCRDLRDLDGTNPFKGPDEWGQDPGTQRRHALVIGRTMPGPPDQVLAIVAGGSECAFPIRLSAFRPRPVRPDRRTGGRETSRLVCCGESPGSTRRSPPGPGPGLMGRAGRVAPLSRGREGVVREAAIEQLGQEPAEVLAVAERDQIRIAAGADRVAPAGGDGLSERLDGLGGQSLASLAFGERDGQ